MSHIVTCPHCSTQIRVPDWNTHKTLFCPRCLAEVDNVWPGSPVRAADINTDVGRDLSVGGIVLAVLIGLCVVGIALAFFVKLKSNKMGGERGEGAAIFSMLVITTCFGALDVLVSIAIVLGLIRRRASGGQAPSVKRVLGITFLSLGTIAAVVIFFFFTCLGLVWLPS